MQCAVWRGQRNLRWEQRPRWRNHRWLPKDLGHLEECKQYWRVYDAIMSQTEMVDTSVLCFTLFQYESAKGDAQPGKAQDSENSGEKLNRSKQLFDQNNRLFNLTYFMHHNTGMTYLNGKRLVFFCKSCGIQPRKSKKCKGWWCWKPWILCKMSVLFALPEKGKMVCGIWARSALWTHCPFKIIAIIE